MNYLNENDFNQIDFREMYIEPIKLAQKEVDLAQNFPTIPTEQPLSEQGSAAAEGRTSGSVEMHIGKYWLNKVGIGSLVLGVVFLILYSYQSLGVIGKLLIGFLVSALLVVGGDSISKRKGEEWYGNALSGGGWALMYFSAYAMHFIPHLKIIDSFAVELVPLFGVASGAMWHAMKNKSQIIALLATLFGTLSVSFGPASLLSYAGYFAIASLASVVAINMRWTKQMFATIVSCYCAYFYTAARLIQPNAVYSIVDNWWSIAALASYWSVFNAAMLTFAQANEGRRNHMNTFTWINFSCFAIGSYAIGSYGLCAWLYWIFGGAAILYMTTENMLEKRGLPFLSTLHILFGLLFLNFAFSLKFHGCDLQNILFLEVPILSAIYLQTNKWVYANFAGTLGVIALTETLFSLLWADAGSAYFGIKSLPLFLSTLVGAATLAATHILFRHQCGSEIEVIAKRNLSNFYYVLTQVAVAGLALSFVNGDTIALYWSIQAGIASLITISQRSAVYSVCSNALIVLAADAIGFSALCNIKPLVCLSVGLFCGLDWTFAHQGLSKKARFIIGDRMLAHIANLMICLLVFRLHSEYITLGLGMAGLAMLIIGFLSRLQVYRGWGLVLLGLLTVKLLLVDLAKADSLERIIAFITAGGICLGCSYAYSKFADKAEPQTRPTERVA